jgi:hypothetical protein
MHIAVTAAATLRASKNEVDFKTLLAFFFVV